MSGQFVNSVGTLLNMQSLIDPIQLTVSREALSGVRELSEELTDRMHALLERNTDGALSDAERAELETLVRIAHFGQAVSAALADSSSK